MFYELWYFSFMANRYFDEEAVRARVFHECRDGQRRWCRKDGLHPQSINDFLKGRKGPDKRLLAALGYRRVVLYERIDSSYIPGGSSEN